MKKFLVLLLAGAFLLMANVPVYAGSGQFPVVSNTTLAIADTEYSYTLGSGVKKITFQCRTAYDVRYAYATGKVATPTAPYMTLKANGVCWEDDLSTKRNLVIYFATDEAGVVVELLIFK